MYVGMMYMYVCVCMCVYIYIYIYTCIDVTITCELANILGYISVCYFATSCGTVVPIGPGPLLPSHRGCARSLERVPSPAAAMAVLSSRH